MSTSLAVRHRPHTWSTVAGQDHLVAVLKSAAQRRPVPQQILLAGPSGVGKTTMARIFAAALFCPNAVDGSGCGECETCVNVTGPGGRHPDVIELDAASHGGIEQIRSLAGEASLAPMLAQWRVYIIDEAHGLTKDGAQAFLRLLEEPPAHTIFILATTDPQKLPDALRGRCLLCYATTPERGDKVANLRRVAAIEGWQLPDLVLETVVDATDPALGVRGTVTNLDKVAGGLPVGGTVSAAEAAVLLGVADPALFSAMTTAITTGDRAGALRSLTRTLEQASRSVVHTQLTEWARVQLHAAAAAGHVEQPTWFLEQLFGHPAEHLEVAVAKMTSPQLVGVDGLPALLERAERALSGLASAPTRPANATAVPAVPAVRAEDPAAVPSAGHVPPASSGQLPPFPTANATSTAADARDHDTPSLPSSPWAVPPSGHAESTPGHDRAQPPAQAQAALPAPADWAPVPSTDARLLAWCNAVAKHDPMWAVYLRRGVIERGAQGWRIHVSHTEDGFRDALKATAGAAVEFL